MATLTTQWPTLLDVARRMDPDGKIAAVAEVLNQYNEILDDIPWMEGNLPTGHKMTVRGSIPTPTFRLFNQGITPTKSTTKQITESTAMLEARSEIDKDEAMMNGNTAEWRFSESKAFIEGINQTLCQALIYGDTTVNPERFIGFAPRYASLSASVTTSVNVINALGSGNVNSSIYCVGWSPETVFGIYPKGSTAGLVHQDLGEQTVYDASLGRMQAMVDRYQFKAGLAIKDYRYVVRIANVDMTNMATVGDTSDTSTNLLKYMSLALEKIFNLNMCRPVFYMNRSLLGLFRVKLLNARNAYLTLEDFKGSSGITRPTIRFQGYPIRRIDQLLSTEATVS